MSQENVEITGQFVTAFNSQDVAALTAVVSAEIEFETLTGNAVTATVYRGHSGFRRYFQFREAKVQWLKTFPDHRTGLEAVGLGE